MNTTMMDHSRRGLTPHKRKEREFLKPPKFIKPSVHKAADTSRKASESGSKNQLLAGYLAHEFLNMGTLFGQTWDPDRVESKPVEKASAESKRGEPSEEKQVERKQRYVDVADLLKGGGAQLPGIVNPTQLVGFLQL